MIIDTSSSSKPTAIAFAKARLDTKLMCLSDFKPMVKADNKDPMKALQVVYYQDFVDSVNNILKFKAKDE